MTTAFNIVVCGSLVPDPLQTLEPIQGPTGPALKNEMMLPSVLDPWAGHSLFEAANLAKQGQVREWATRQVYIALGNFMTCCATLGVDTCPMEGIVPAEYDKLLGLEGGDFTTVVACAAGYRAAGDKYASLPKVRFSASEVIQRA